LALLNGLANDHLLTINEHGENERVIHDSLVLTGTEPVVTPAERTASCGVSNEIDSVDIRSGVNNGT